MSIRSSFIRWRKSRDLVGWRLRWERAYKTLWRLLTRGVLTPGEFKRRNNVLMHLIRYDQ